MPVVYRVTIPDNMEVVNLSGEVDGYQYVMLVEASTNRPLLIINQTRLRVRQRGELPPPLPVEYTTYHTLQAMNVRLQPSTHQAPVSSAPANVDLMLSTEPVTPQLLQRLGLPALEIEAGYEWRAIVEGNFIASKIGTKDTVALGAYAPPAPPSASPNLKMMSANGKLSIAIKGSTRPIEGFVNMRALAFCGLPRVEGTSQGDIARHLDTAQNVGARLVRFYTACIDLSAAACADRVHYVLDELHKRGMLGILVLNDSLGSGFHVAGDENYRIGMPLGHLSYEYYARDAYIGNYFTHVQTLLNKVGAHPAIASWDLMNETGGYGRGIGVPIPVQDTANLRTFASATVSLIRDESPHWINWGLISSAHVGCETPAEAEAFYQGLGLNVMGVHLYKEEVGGWVNEGRALSDAGVAKKLGMPIWVDEFGVWFEGSSRQAEYSAAVERYKPWCAGFGVWGWNALSAQMNFSDNLGVSVHLPDFGELAALVQSYA